MIKKYFILAGLISGLCVTAQVGINTATPTATLDVTGIPADPLKLDGIIAPRLSGDELSAKTYTGAQTGAIVYATAAAGSLTGQVMNVTEPGYYYFDGTVWQTFKEATNWKTTGNDGTTAGTNFLGTTDNVDMVFKRNNVVSGSLRTNNTSFGVGSLPLTTTGIGNVAFGDNTLPSNTTASYNVAIGSSVLAVNTTGFSNVGVGSFTFLSNTSGSQSVAVGVNSARFNTTGFNNTSVGYVALRNNTEGIGNTGVGHSSLSATTGNNNTAIGLSSGVNITTGSNNIAIGYNTNLQSSTASNQMNIGNAIFGTGLTGSVGLPAGNIGIGTNAPTEKLDVANGNVRVRDINTNVGNGATDRTVVADANGVLKTLDFGSYTLFHARLAASQNLTANTITPLLFTTPLATSPLYTYNIGTGVMTFNQSGNYLVTMQAGFSNIVVGTQMVMGIRPFPDAPYLGRGSHNNAVATSGTIGELMNYTTMIVVPNAGYQVRFVAVTNSSSTVLATETGATGSGNVTNVTVQKI